MDSLTTGRVSGPKCLALCRWFLDQPELAQVVGPPLSSSKRIRVYNIDGRALSHHNFAEMVKMLEADMGFFISREYKVPVDFTIKSDDPDLLVWLKMKFL